MEEQHEEYSNIIQIGIETLVTGIQYGVITAPATITICSNETVNFSALGGSFPLIDNVPVGIRSDSSLLSTNTLIDGARVKVNLDNKHSNWRRLFFSHQGKKKHISNS